MEVFQCYLFMPMSETVSAGNYLRLAKASSLKQYTD